MVPRSLAARTASCLQISALIISIVYSTSAFALPEHDRAWRTHSNEEQVISVVASNSDNAEIPSTQSSNPFETVPSLMNGLEVMQEQYFELWQGTWPTAIDWTAAVLGSHVSSTLSTLSAAVDYLASPEPTTSNTNAAHENLINEYFSQLISSYFGQEAFRLRNEAYDDMLWVVLSWLESVKFIRFHSDLHYKQPQRPLNASETNSKHSAWYGNKWVPSFAHRARLFWDLAAKGWDEKLCGGGMIWSPWLLPYKNAITNELFIAASISMYLYFPGDENASPFGAEVPVQGPRDPKYLQYAIKAYMWLASSNMTNSQGLYVDGYHIRGYEQDRSRTTCDDRNEMVYTYNQGVILSGQRGLWEATGSISYLQDGHTLIANVINATGYDLKHNRIYDNDSDRDLYPNLAKWHGMGRLGILEEVCDAYAYCSQNGQTFKSIFWHHLTLFCAPLPPHALEPGNGAAASVFEETQSWHAETCASYGLWIKRNAEAAMSTRDEKGRFGEWWGAPSSVDSKLGEPRMVVPDGALDYRNGGVPDDARWKEPDFAATGRREGCDDGTTARGRGGGGDGDGGKGGRRLRLELRSEERDVNDRGRGRTVETQAGGIGVLRALWELVEIPALARMGR